MGLSSKKTTTKSNQTTSGTTTPTTPSWLAQPIQGFTGKIDQFLQGDPSQLVAGASPLQSQAFAGAQNLGGWQAGANEALNMAKTAGAAPAAQASTATYSAPQLGAPSQVGEVNIAPVATARAESMMDGFGRYMDPATNALVKASLAEHDAQTGRQSAAMDARAASSKAFGGSRAGIAEGEFQAATGRGRALTDAELRARAFSQAVNMSQFDTANRQNTGFFNAGAENTRNLNQAQLAMQGNLANTGYENQFDLAQAGLDENAGQFNAAAQNQGSMFNAQMQEAERQRALQAAGLTANISSNLGEGQRADLALTGQLGEMERAIAQAQKLAPLAQLQAGGQLYGGLPYNAFVGQQINGTMNGTNVQKSDGGLFNTILGAASLIPFQGGIKI